MFWITNHKEKTQNRQLEFILDMAQLKYVWFQEDVPFASVPQGLIQPKPQPIDGTPLSIATI